MSSSGFRGNAPSLLDELIAAQLQHDEQARQANRPNTANDADLAASLEQEEKTRHAEINYNHPDTSNDAQMAAAMQLNDAGGFGILHLMLMGDVNDPAALHQLMVNRRLQNRQQANNQIRDLFGGLLNRLNASRRQNLPDWADDPRAFDEAKGAEESKAAYVPPNQNVIVSADLARRIEPIIQMEIEGGVVSSFRPALDELEISERKLLVSYLVTKYSGFPSFRENPHIERQIKGLDELGIFLPVDEMIKKFCGKENAENVDQMRGQVRACFLKYLNALDKELNPSNANNNSPADNNQAAAPANNAPSSLPPRQPSSAPVLSNPLAAASPSLYPNPAPRPRVQPPVEWDGIIFGADISEELRTKIFNLRVALQWEIEQLQTKRQSSYFHFFQDFEISTKQQKLDSLKMLDTSSLRQLQHSAGQILDNKSGLRTNWRFINTTRHPALQNESAFAKSRTTDLLKELRDLGASAPAQGVNNNRL